MIKDPLFLKLWHSAKPYLKRAHSPYSHFKVASSVLMNDGKIYSGCNVENASYGATICAERTAILKAISEGAKKIKAILVLTDNKVPWPPCGMCRQVMAEFSNPNTIVYISNLKKEYSEIKFAELFPGSFDKSYF